MVPSDLLLPSPVRVFHLCVCRDLAVILPPHILQMRAGLSRVEECEKQAGSYQIGLPDWPSDEMIYLKKKRRIDESRPEHRAADESKEGEWREHRAADESKGGDWREQTLTTLVCSRLLDSRPTESSYTRDRPQSTIPNCHLSTRSSTLRGLLLFRRVHKKIFFHRGCSDRLLVSSLSPKGCMHIKGPAHGLAFVLLLLLLLNMWEVLLIC